MVLDEPAGTGGAQVNGTVPPVPAKAVSVTASQHVTTPGATVGGGPARLFGTKLTPFGVGFGPDGKSGLDPLVNPVASQGIQ